MSVFYPPRNFGAIPPEAAARDTARVAILPVPYDSTSSYKAGSRDGPQAIVDASQYMELFDHELGREIYEVGIHTLPELEPVMSGPEAMVARVREVVADLLAQDKFVVCLGGEHTISLGAVQAHLARYSGLSVLQLDAHADLRDNYLGTPYNHACVMRRVHEICPVVPVGIRALSAEEWDFVQDGGPEPIWAERVGEDGDWIAEAMERLGDQVYVTIDLDVLDPSIMAAVGTPEPGGLGWYEVVALLRRVAAAKQVVGFDVVELCPDQGPAASSFLAARLAYKLIGFAT